MKYYILFITVLLGAPSYAQSDIQIVKIKHEDGSVSVSAINHSDIVYSITVDINLEGMKLEYPIKSYIKIFPGDEKEVAILKPTANKTKYIINFQATALEDRGKVTTDGTVPDITIYTKNGQEKSTELRLYLMKHNIEFYEINTTFNDKSDEIYLKMLNRRGIEKSDAKLPVVIIRGEIFYDIRNIKQFIKEHF